MIGGDAKHTSSLLRQGAMCGCTEFYQNPCRVEFRKVRSWWSHVCQNHTLFCRSVPAVFRLDVYGWQNLTTCDLLHDFDNAGPTAVTCDL